MGSAKSIIGKLRAAKAARGGHSKITLPETGVVVTAPNFKPSAAFIAAQVNEPDAVKAQIAFVINICVFDGERLTADEYADLIPARDHLEIISMVMGKAKTPQ
ncbi:MAG: hypothetical protein KGL46_13150 [Hyphomicrobiales bacterium]|nr:hypothetical protein [Hyphomicrobiales bacterium]